MDSQYPSSPKSTDTDYKPYPLKQDAIKKGPIIDTVTAENLANADKQLPLKSLETVIDHEEVL